MGAKYELEISDLPPKKYGANSMWNKSSEASKIIALRKEALAKIKDIPLRKNLRLTIYIYLQQNNKNIGDLDNFITGICDGLMTAKNKAKISPKFEGMPEINPRAVEFIEDDFRVLKINAEKILINEVPHYEVIIEEID